MNYKHTQYWHFGQSTMCPWDQWLLSWTVKQNDRQNTLFFLLFVFFPLACLFYLHLLSIQKYFSVMPWALFCFLLKLCVWASEEAQRDFGNAIQFSKHASTVFCLLPYCSKKCWEDLVWKRGCFLVFVLLRDTRLDQPLSLVCSCSWSHFCYKNTLTDCFLFMSCKMAYFIW